MTKDAGGDVLFCEGNVVNESDCQAWGHAVLDNHRCSFESTFIHM